MSSPSSDRPPAGAGWSLERRLPFLIMALLACVVGGISFAAYREVRATAVSRIADRLERVVHELTVSAARSVVVRTAHVARVVSDPTITGALTGPVDSGRVAARLEAARQPGDSTVVGWQLTALDGTPRFRTAARWSDIDSAALLPALAEAARTGGEARTPLRGVGQQVHYWSVTPVRAGGRMIGTLAELQRLGNQSSAEAMIRELVGEEVRLFYANHGAPDWASLDGSPAPAPFARPAAESRTTTALGPDGRRFFVVQQTIPHTPILIVLFQAESSVLRRPQEFLWRILGAGVLVLAIATIGAWLLSRHVTRPLHEVTDAAAALARGDYGQRVDTSVGGREVASLATTFNVMAAGLGDAHATLAERNEELQRANAAKAQFLAMMSHELRTPLNAIAGFTELIELGLRGPVTREQVEDLGRIRRNKDLLLSIITDILDFARAEAGALSLQRVAVPVATVLADAVDTIGHQMAAKRVRLELQPVPEDAVVRGDPEKIEQVLLNLLSNALKFTEPGGEVVITTTVVEQAVRIDVRDSGSGIVASQLDAIFEPFVQADAALTRRVGGAGLGLAIARQLVDAMNGTLTVRSRTGAGSTFTVTLPHAERARHGGVALASATPAHQADEQTA